MIPTQVFFDAQGREIGRHMFVLVLLAAGHWWIARGIGLDLN